MLHLNKKKKHRAEILCLTVSWLCKFVAAVTADHDDAEWGDKIVTGNYGHIGDRYTVICVMSTDEWEWVL